MALATVGTTNFKGINTMGYIKENEYDFSREMISKIKESEVRTNKKALNEEKKGQPIAITNDPKFGENVLRHQIEEFKTTVHSGAKFGEENANEPESNPLVYYPESGNLVFSGTIPTLSGLKFQYSLNDVTNAPYVFVDGLALTDDVMTTLRKMCGHFKNWKEEFLSATDLLEKIGN